MVIPGSPVVELSSVAVVELELSLLVVPRESNEVDEEDEEDEDAGPVPGSTVVVPSGMGTHMPPTPPAE